jgi:hypothetical protein
MEAGRRHLIEATSDCHPKLVFLMAAMQNKYYRESIG